jgi:hypothetical protein
VEVGTFPLGTIGEVFVRFMAKFLRGTLPPVLFLAVCFVLAIPDLILIFPLVGFDGDAKEKGSLYLLTITWHNKEKT